MRILTLKAIRENPWNVVAYALPAHPSRLLLEASHFAADYCRKSECMLMFAARDGRYTPMGWEATDDYSDIHKDSEACSDDADERLNDICDLYQATFDESLERCRYRRLRRWGWAVA